MIVVDSSVFIAVLEQEPEAERFLSIIRDATPRLASAVTVYETGIVIGARRACALLLRFDNPAIVSLKQPTPTITPALCA